MSIRRVDPWPRPSSVTERKALAQAIRNDLATYKRIASSSTAERDRVLARIAQNFNRIIELEGVRVDGTS